MSTKSWLLLSRPLSTIITTVATAVLHDRFVDLLRVYIRRTEEEGQGHGSREAQEGQLRPLSLSQDASAGRLGRPWSRHVPCHVSQACFAAHFSLIWALQSGPGRGRVSLSVQGKAVEGKSRGSLRFLPSTLSPP